MSFASAANNCPNSHPSLIVKEKMGDSIEIALVSEKQIIAHDINGLKAPVLLLAAFYAFNMSYPKGLSSLCMLLEILLCKQRPRSPPNSVSNALIGLQ